ncbi:DegT/DnrJ/EryC1/StrS aminotransferase family protein [Oceanispirochaeta sp. M1]|uniref:DegT/DnrJ/EryC1/StrS family aminotransferase n=2 Tax=Oceanispirochaeta TaxID=2035349 RepID=UPI0014951C07|nr:DegT/DnrJ/EryC1/StrS aminotransferase family protein [Oceanispirochaeta sp. M1]MBF9015711.1 DegT/DnrJ/EryC1/StrS aminotransferase family protein [Oceanispirochaeta sp. M2]
MNLSTETIPFARPSLGKEEEDAVLRVMRSGWLTTGAEALAFEKEFETYTGATHALAVNSATAGLHLVLEALGLKPGDKVLVPTYTFTASAEVIRYCGADPVFVDPAEGSMNMDPAECEKIIRALQKEGSAIKGIMAVHIAGDPEFLEELWTLSRKYNLFLIEDAAHCFPVNSERGMIGTWTDAAVYSFYANKTITTGEGGMVVTGSEKIRDRVNVMRLHGINKAVWARYTETGAPWEYDVIAPGFKYNMSDMAAAIGRVQLRRAVEFLNKRKEAAQTYLNILGNSEVSELLDLPRWKEDHAWHLFIITLKLEKLNISRNDFIRMLNERGVGTSVHFKPLHMMSYYKKYYSLKEEDYPLSSELYRRVVSLPLFPDMSREQIQRVCETVIDLLKAGMS